jgi:hypothetical protein
MVKRKGDDVNSESKRHRIMCERNLDDNDIAEMLVYEDLENNFIPPDSDSCNTENDSNDGRDVYIVVILPDSSPLYCALPLPFTETVGINVVVKSCESIMAFID